MTRRSKSKQSAATSRCLFPQTTHALAGVETQTENANSACGLHPLNLRGTTFHLLSEATSGPTCLERSGSAAIPRHMQRVQTKNTAGAGVTVIFGPVHNFSGEQNRRTSLPLTVRRSLKELILDPRRRPPSFAFWAQRVADAVADQSQATSAPKDGRRLPFLV